MTFVVDAPLHPNKQTSIVSLGSLLTYTERIATFPLIPRMCPARLSVSIRNFMFMQADGGNGERTSELFLFFVEYHKVLTNAQYGFRKNGFRESLGSDILRHRGSLRHRSAVTYSQEPSWMRCPTPNDTFYRTLPV